MWQNANNIDIAKKVLLRLINLLKCFHKKSRNNHSSAIGNTITKINKTRYCWDPRGTSKKPWISLVAAGASNICDIAKDVTRLMPAAPNIGVRYFTYLGLYTSSYSPSEPTLANLGT
jgi:hypothetical protein